MASTLTQFGNSIPCLFFVPFAKVEHRKAAVVVMPNVSIGGVVPIGKYHGADGAIAHRAACVHEVTDDYCRAQE